MTMTNPLTCCLIDQTEERLAVSQCNTISCSGCGFLWLAAIPVSCFHAWWRGSVGQSKAILLYLCIFSFRVNPDIYLYDILNGKHLERRWVWTLNPYILINKVDTTNRCEALKEVYVFKMFDIKTFLYQTPPSSISKSPNISDISKRFIYDVLKHLIYLILNLVDVHTVTPSNQDALHLKIIIK